MSTRFFFFEISKKNPMLRSLISATALIVSRTISTRETPHVASNMVVTSKLTTTKNSAAFPEGSRRE